MYKTTFAELKTRAKDVLKSNYWYSFGVCILVSLITSLGTSVATVTNMVNSGRRFGRYINISRTSNINHSFCHISSKRGIVQIFHKGNCQRT